MTGSISGFITGGIGGGACFVAGTAVLTSAGLVAIENIRAGDTVWAENPETGDKALKQVVRTFDNQTSELVHVFANGEEIITTPEHPFYVPQKGWTGSIELRAGDILVLSNGNYVIVEKIQHEILEAPIHVYNFEVQDFHTYYVGDQSVLVHNLCRSSAVKKAWKMEQKAAKTGQELSRKWSKSEVKQLIKTGKVKGYVGHHMKSVKGYPQYAGDWRNIQFLTRQQHFAAHNYNWRNITHGRYYY